MPSRSGSITIRFEDAELRAALERAASGVRPEARSALDRSGKRLKADMRGRLTRLKKKDTERLYKAIDYRLGEAGEDMTVEVGPRVGDPRVEPYDVVVDQGRGKNKPPPPTFAIRPWVRRRGMDDSAAFPIARAIGIQGIAPAPYIQIAGDKTVTVLREVDQVLTFVRKQFGT